MSQSTNLPTFYLVHALDAPGAGPLREQLSAAHRQYMELHRSKILVGGPLLDDSGLQRIGSAFIIQANSREQVNELMQQEPYSMGSLFEQVIIRRFTSAMFDPALLQEEGKDE